MYRAIPPPIARYIALLQAGGGFGAGGVGGVGGVDAADQLVLEGEALGEAVGQALQPGGEAAEVLADTAGALVFGVEGEHQLGGHLQPRQQAVGELQGGLVLEGLGLLAQLGVDLEVTGADVVHQKLAEAVDLRLAHRLELGVAGLLEDRKSTRLNSSHVRTPHATSCSKNKNCT